MDRLITIHVDYFDRETEVAIAAARSGVSYDDASRVVDLVRRHRERNTGRHRPSLRAAIMIARVVAQRGGTFDSTDLIFQRTYRDVLGLDREHPHSTPKPRSHEMMNTELSDTCDLVEAAVQESV